MTDLNQTLETVDQLRTIIRDQQEKLELRDTLLANILPHAETRAQRPNQGFDDHIFFEFYNMYGAMIEKFKRELLNGRERKESHSFHDLQVAKL